MYQTTITTRTKQHFWPVGHEVMRCNNREARQCVIAHTEFMANNMFGVQQTKRIDSYDASDGPRNHVVDVPENYPKPYWCYVVYSYGAHFPLYIWDVDTQRWFGNSGSYSRTTSKHSTLTRPTHREEILWVNTQVMQNIQSYGVFEATMLAALRINAGRHRA